MRPNTFIALTPILALALPMSARANLQFTSKNSQYNPSTSTQVRGVQRGGANPSTDGFLPHLLVGIDAGKPPQLFVAQVGTQGDTSKPGAVYTATTNFSVGQGAFSVTTSSSITYSATPTATFVAGSPPSCRVNNLAVTVSPSGLCSGSTGTLWLSDYTYGIISASGGATISDPPSAQPRANFSTANPLSLHMNDIGNWLRIQPGCAPTGGTAPVTAGTDVWEIVPGSGVCTITKIH